MNTHMMFPHTYELTAVYFFITTDPAVLFVDSTYVQQGHTRFLSNL